MWNKFNIVTFLGLFNRVNTRLAQADTVLQIQCALFFKIGVLQKTLVLQKEDPSKYQSPCINHKHSVSLLTVQRLAGVNSMTGVGSCLAQGYCVAAYGASGVTRIIVVQVA